MGVEYFFSVKDEFISHAALEGGDDRLAPWRPLDSHRQGVNGTVPAFRFFKWVVRIWNVD
ncbi:hypothetical protein MA16_Dca019548 [Dendrobium catenatum]|uniref:Uncharacterized protein n=1 Tax=Dendrobium catenatum TaxID=906689 RepID=A0A2I0XAI5_9ASPA|nr:hypothetical protein MA16_Dca019548 [Dendrobium catenatum]